MAAASAHAVNAATTCRASLQGEMIHTSSAIVPPPPVAGTGVSANAAINANRTARKRLRVRRTNQSQIANPSRISGAATQMDIQTVGSLMLCASAAALHVQSVMMEIRPRDRIVVALSMIVMLLLVCMQCIAADRSVEPELFATHRLLLTPSPAQRYILPLVPELLDDVKQERFADVVVIDAQGQPVPRRISAAPPTATPIPNFPVSCMEVDRHWGPPVRHPTEEELATAENYMNTGTAPPGFQLPPVRTQTTRYRCKVATGAAPVNALLLDLFLADPGDHASLELHDTNGAVLASTPLIGLLPLPGRQAPPLRLLRTFTGDNEFDLTLVDVPGYSNVSNGVAQFEAPLETNGLQRLASEDSNGSTDRFRYRVPDLQHIVALRVRADTIPISGLLLKLQRCWGGHCTSQVEPVPPLVSGLLPGVSESVTFGLSDPSSGDTLQLETSTPQIAAPQVEAELDSPELIFVGGDRPQPFTLLLGTAQTVPESWRVELPPGNFGGEGIARLSAGGASAGAATMWVRLKSKMDSIALSHFLPWVALLALLASLIAAVIWLIRNPEG